MSVPSSRPRLPLSPASPPESGVKQQSEHHGSAVTPQTPPSPEHMSVATKRYVSSYEDGRHTNEMANRSSESYMSQAQRPSISQNNSQQPNTLKRPLSQDGDEERPTSKRQRKDEKGETEDAMEVGSSYVATNHDRQKEQPYDTESNTAAIVEETAAKRNAFAEGNMPDNLDPILEDAFKTRTSTHRRAPFDMSHHLLGRYGLHPLLATVARIDPTTGEKINKLRKSYEGQIKAAQLSGKNKTHAMPREDNGLSRLRNMAQKAEQEFEETLPKETIGDLSGLQSVMNSALRLNPGTMKGDTTREWDEILGHDVRRPGLQPQTQQSQQQLQHSRIPNGVRTVQSSILAHQAPQDKMRTRGKKRSYDDSSFTGYRGFADGLSEPEETDRDQDYADRGKKRRKD